MGAPGWQIWLPLLRTHLPGCLVTDRSWNFLHRLTPHLPADAFGVLELRLDPDSSAVDFSVGLTDRVQASTLAETLAFPAPAILSRWGQGEAVLRGVSALWLEFDQPQADRAESPPPAPLVCAKLVGSAEPTWITKTLIPSLQSGHLGPETERIVQDCLRAVPQGAEVLYVFDLAVRGAAALRLELIGLQPAQMARYLGRVAPQAIPQVERAASLLPTGDRYHLSLDIGQAISPRIGVECSFIQQPPTEPRWSETLARLVDAGLCSEEKRRAILDWPGVDSFLSAPETWPLAAVGGRGVRALSHVKLVTWPGREPEAKTYLLFRHFYKGRRVPYASKLSGRF